MATLSKVVANFELSIQGDNGSLRKYVGTHVIRYCADVELVPWVGLSKIELKMRSKRVFDGKPLLVDINGSPCRTTRSERCRVMMSQLSYRLLLHHAHCFFCVEGGRLCKLLVQAAWGFQIATCDRWVMSSQRGRDGREMKVQFSCGPMRNRACKTEKYFELELVPAQVMASQMTDSDV